MTQKSQNKNIQKPWYIQYRWWLIAGGIILISIFALAGNTANKYYGWTTEPQTPQELSDFLSPYYITTLPENTQEGQKFPTVILFPGCDGPRENMIYWKSAFAKMGWASVIIDSHTPRGYMKNEQWRLVCAAQQMLGTERAGDVIVGLSDVLEMDFVDTNRIVFFGVSHGGWALSEAMLNFDTKTLPYTLTSWPENLNEKEDMLENIIAEMFLYPYVGTLNNAHKQGWVHPAPTLFMMAGDDIIVNNKGTLELIGRLQQNSIPVEIHLYPDATHGFDQPNKTPLSPLQYDSETRDAAIRDTEIFLQNLEQ